MRRLSITQVRAMYQAEHSEGGESIRPETSSESITISWNVGHHSNSTGGVPNSLHARLICIALQMSCKAHEGKCQTPSSYIFEGKS